MSALSRRDFLNGSALSLLAGTTLAPSEILGLETRPPYPPALTGMRGSHEGSFETAHALAWDRVTWPRPKSRTDGLYDLVIVGGGLSGLSAAYFYRQHIGPDARILILDNHDDFGGHAKRNEFSVDGRLVVGYGGSQSIDTPSGYSIAAMRLLEELGIHTDEFYDYFDRRFEEKHQLDDGVLFSKPVFEENKFTANAASWFGNLDSAEQQGRIAAYPVTDATKRALMRMARGDIAWSAQTKAQIRTAAKTPTEAFLTSAFGMTKQGLTLLRDRSRPLWGIGLDALSLKETVLEGMLGTAAMEAAYAPLAGTTSPRDEHEPYIFHFPDGNASIARLLVRTLIPGSIAGSTMADIVTAIADYSRLDRTENMVRIRLNSTAVSVENRAGGVDVTYRRSGQTERVHSRHCILACYNDMIPYLCSELGEEQVQALEYPEKVPLAIVNVALRHWRPIASSGLGSFYAPGRLLCTMGMDFPVSIGDYVFTRNPDEPAILQGWHAPATYNPGRPIDERYRAGRTALYQTPFATFETETKQQLDLAWGPHGLDVERDIAAITVNRWPHGYAYEYMDLWDDPSWSRGAGPHVVARQQINRISIANSDSESYAYVNGAIDAAYRAVREQTT